MPARKPLTPEPVIKSQVCTVCGLGWDRHGKTPTVAKCIELLKADNARLRSPGANVRIWGTNPYFTNGPITAA